MASLPGVVELLEYMLVRDPQRRPTLSDVALRYSATGDTLWYWLAKAPCHTSDATTVGFINFKTCSVVLLGC